MYHLGHNINCYLRSAKTVSQPTSNEMQNEYTDGPQLAVYNNHSLPAIIWQSASLT